MKSITTINHLKKLYSILLTMLFFFSEAHYLQAQSLNTGNVVVLQVGDGSAALSASSTPVFLKEFTTSGAATSTITIPTTGAARLTVSGSATTEGQITRSNDGASVIIAGYDAATGVASISGTTPAVSPRVVNTVSLSGVVARGASTNTQYAGSFRSAAGGNGSDFWGAGAQTGTYYLGTSAAAAAVQAIPSNTRVVSAMNGNLYFSTGSGTQGIYKFSGLPTASAAGTVMIGVTNPLGFAINSSETIAYVAIDAASGGIQKWVFSGTWSLAYTLSTGTAGTRGVCVDFSGANPVVYATTNEASANRLIKFTDTGIGSTFTLLATAPTNTAYRSVAFSPVGGCVSPSLSAALTHASCNGFTNGAINLSTTGGTSPFTFSWSNGATSEDLTGLAAGSYTVTVTAAGGCTTSATYTITQPAPVPATASNSGPVCAGNPISFTSGGGVSYSWSGPNGFVSSLQNPSINPTVAADSGVFTVIVTDGSGCTGTATTLAEVQNCGCLPPVATGVITQPTCNGGNNGSIDVSVTGGVSPYAFTWSTGALTEDVTGLSAGVYSVIVSDGIACVDTFFFNVGEPTVITALFNNVNPGCQGFSNGSIDMTPSGGTPGYTFVWGNGAVTEDISGLTAGLYSVTITDANGCVANSFTVLTDPGLFTLSATGNNISCFGVNNGSINVTASNDTVNTTNPGLLISEFFANPSGADSSKEWIELIATKFIDFSVTPYTIIAANNGTATTQGWVQGGVSIGTTSSTYAFQISSGTVVPGEVVYVGGSNMSVTGRKIRMIDVSTTGGDGGIGGATTNGIVGNGTGNADGIAVFNLPATSINANTVPVDAIFYGTGIGTSLVNGGVDGYTLPVNDRYNGGRLQSTSFLAPDPTSLFVLATGTYNTLSGAYSVLRTWTGNAASSFSTSSVTLGSGNSYLWSNGATSEDIFNLAGGTYTVTATNSSGCTATTTVVISEPVVLNVSATIFDVSCYGASDGSIDVSVSGGTTPYTYLWNDGDFNEDRSALPTGVYNVTITDAGGCIANQTFIVNQPADIAYSTVVTNPTCFGGSDGAIDLTVSGGTAPYSFSWSNGDTTEDIINQPASFYFFNITDANGCVSGGIDFINDPAQIVITGFAPVTGGAGVLVNISGSGFTGVTQVDFNGTAAASFTVINDNQVNAVVPVGASTGLISMGTSPTCIVSSVDTFYYDPAACIPPSISAVATNASCFGASDGSIDLTVTGGVSPYTYSWSNGSNGEDIAGLFAGVYTVIVTGANSCPDTLVVTVAEPGQIVLSAFVSHITCNGLTDGAINLFVFGGTSPFTYSWSNGSTVENISGLSAGTYTVTVIDNNSCAASNNFTIIEPAVLTVTISGVNPLCAGDATGSASSAVSGGTIPYFYNWSNGASTSGISGIAAGTYTLTVTDSSGCQASATTTLTDPPVFSLSVTSTTDVSCFGGNTGAIDITASNDPGSSVVNPGLLISEFIADPPSNDNPFEWVELVATKPINFSLTPYTVVFANNGTGTTKGWRAGGIVTYAFQISSGIVNPGDVFYVGGSSMTPTGLKLRTINTATTAGDGFGNANGGLGNGGANADGIAIFNVASSAIDSSTVPVDAVLFGSGIGTALVSGGTAGYTLPVNDRYSGGFISSGSFLAPNSVASTPYFKATGGYNYGTGVYTPRVWTLSATFTDGTSSVSITTNNTYIWSTGATTQDISGLAAGTYTVTATNQNGCIATATATINQPNDLTIATFVPASGSTGTTVVLSGTGFTGVDVVEFNGVSASFVIDNDGQITTSVPAGATTGNIKLTNNGCDSVFSATPFIVISTATVNITAFIEGYYNGAGGLVPALLNSGVGASATECDTIYVELRDQISPTTVLASGTAVMSTSGQASFTFPGSVIGQNGYIAVFHRNAVQTWSDIITFSATTSYDFTTAASQAYNGNQREVAPGVWAFYSGDLSPQDEFIDILDQGVIDNDIFNFAGGYVVSDLSGDGFVDIVDQSIVDNNIFNFIGSSHP